MGGAGLGWALENEVQRWWAPRDLHSSPTVSQACAPEMSTGPFMHWLRNAKVLRESIGREKLGEEGRSPTAVPPCTTCWAPVMRMPSFQPTCQLEVSNFPLHLQGHLSFYLFLLCSWGRQLIEGLSFVQPSKCLLTCLAFPMNGSLLSILSPLLSLLGFLCELFLFLSRLEWCKLVERAEAFCLSSHGREGWSGARATASLHTWLEPGQAANAFLGLSHDLLETDECCRLGEGIPARDVCGDAVPGEPRASWRRRALLRATQREADLIEAWWLWNCPS